VGLFSLKFRVLSQKAAAPAAKTPLRSVAAAPPNPPRPRAAAPPVSGGKGPPRLFFELYWGEVRQQARAFGEIPAKQPVLGGHDDALGMPLWGFELEAGPMVLAEKSGPSYRIFVPPGAEVERRDGEGNFALLAAEQLETAGGRRFVGLANGDALRFTNDESSLVAYVQPPLRAPWANPLAHAPLVTLGLFVLFLGAFGAFVSLAPSDELPDFTAKNVPPVAVRLMTPEPKKKEEARQRLEKIKKQAPEKKEVAVKERPVARPAQISKALQKISAAGPSIKNLLASMDKLGGGPGKKDAKTMESLLGKAPVAALGTGAFGLGGTGSRGVGTQGLEVLRGTGGHGIGALGAGNIGKRAVNGTVGIARARTMVAVGMIDKEAVAKVINSHLSVISACYERALLKEAGLSGKIVLEWSISTSGSVTNAKTKSSTVRSSAVESCILSALKSWAFPAARSATVVVTYPFMFNSVGY
jgi:TonB family protein